MSYRVATRVTFTPEYQRLAEDEQTAEQLAAYGIVAQFGGTIEAQHVLLSENCLLTIASYPDQASALKSEMEITARRAFVLQSQPTVTVDEIIALQAEAKAQRVVNV